MLLSLPPSPTLSPPPLCSADIMGPTRNNRKRTRHRPTNRARKQLAELKPAPVQFQSPVDREQNVLTRSQFISTIKSTLEPCSSNNSMSMPSTFHSRSSSMESTFRHNDLDRRIFGGSDDGPEDFDLTTGTSDLRGPMLDVVFSLFNGIDYDDALC